MELRPKAEFNIGTAFLVVGAAALIATISVIAVYQGHLFAHVSGGASFFTKKSLSALVTDAGVALGLGTGLAGGPLLAMYGISLMKNSNARYRDAAAVIEQQQRQ